MWLKLPGRFIASRRGHQDSAFLAKVSLAVDTRPPWWARACKAPGPLAERAGAWLGLGARDSGQAAWARGRLRGPPRRLLTAHRGSRRPPPARPRGAPTLPGPGLPRWGALGDRRPPPPGLRRGQAGRREVGLRRPGRAAFEVCAGQLRGRWVTPEGRGPRGPAWVSGRKGPAEGRTRNEYGSCAGERPRACVGGAWERALRRAAWETSRHRRVGARGAREDRPCARVRGQR